MLIKILRFRPKIDRVVSLVESSRDVMGVRRFLDLCFSR